MPCGKPPSGLLPLHLSEQEKDGVRVDPGATRRNLPAYLVVVEYGVRIHILPWGHVEPQFPHEVYLVRECQGGPWAGAAVRAKLVPRLRPHPCGLLSRAGRLLVGVGALHGLTMPVTPPRGYRGNE